MKKILIAVGVIVGIVLVFGMAVALGLKINNKVDLGRSFSPVYPLISAATATSTGTLTTMLTKDYNHVIFAVDTSGSTNATIKFTGSVMEVPHDPLVVQSVTNTYDYIEVVDLQNGSSIDGDTGLALTGTDDHRLFELNISALTWITPVITAYTSGTIDVRAIASDNQ